MSTKKNRVLITGGSGFVGQSIVQRLIQSDVGVRLLLRNPRKFQRKQPFLAEGCELIEYDLTGSRDPDPAIFYDVDTVIHLVGIISETSDNSFDKVHVMATKRLLSAASQGGIRRFIHMSALGTRESAISRYHQTKWEAETAVRESNLQYTLFRPSLIYGPGDHLVTLFTRLARFTPILALPPAGEARVQPVHIDNVTTAFVNAIDSEMAVGRTYELCGPERMTLEVFAKRVTKAAGMKRWMWSIPENLAHVQARLCECFFPLFHATPPLTRDQLIMLKEDNIGDGETAARELGFSLIQLEDALEILFARPKSPH